MLSPRPLVASAFVQTMLDISENEVLELVEEGLLHPAFNLAVSPATRRELRLLYSGVMHYATTQRPLPADPAQVCSDLIPPDGPCTTATLKRILNCSGELVVDLVKAKAFTLAPGEQLKRGRFGAAKVERESALQFLESRLL